MARRVPSPNSPTPPRGRFIVLEGIDGAGTTTQGKRLVQWLRRQGLSALFTFEPSSLVVGRHLRRALAARPGPSPARMALLFAADRLDHYEQLVGPALAAGRWVVCDRYVLSSLAYQGVEADAAWVATLNARAPEPDLTLFVDVPVEVAVARRQERGLPADRYEVTPFQRAVADRYRDLARRARIPTIDGTAAIDVVAAAIQRQVQRLLDKSEVAPAQRTRSQRHHHR